MFIGTALRKQLLLKAHAISKSKKAERFMVIQVDSDGEEPFAMSALGPAVAQGAQYAKGKGVA